MGIVEFGWTNRRDPATRMIRARLRDVLGDPQPRPVGRAIARRRVELLGDPVEFCGTAAGAVSDCPVAVISDVHGNLPALEAVLADIEAAGIERIWCLGDTTGYGAHPVECLRLVRDRCEVVLAGNHDLAVVGDEDLAMFGGHARAGVIHAQRELEQAEDGPVLREWLALRLTEVADARRSARYDLTCESQLAHHRMDALCETNIVAAHAAPSPYDTVWDYVGVDVEPADLAREFDRRSSLILVGHAHEQFSRGGVCNPGSVGQPRDGAPRAAWAELSTMHAQPGEQLHVVLRRTEYDIERAQDAMRAVDLPTMTIERLAVGI